MIPGAGMRTSSSQAAERQEVRLHLEALRAPRARPRGAKAPARRLGAPRAVRRGQGRQGAVPVDARPARPVSGAQGLQLVVGGHARDEMAPEEAVQEGPVHRGAPAGGEVAVHVRVQGLGVGRELGHVGDVREREQRPPEAPPRGLAAVGARGRAGEGPRAGVGHLGHG
eukprot:CAMPEP_0206017212 /NCGR_PEP_ID=MMETSP1464-20131121/24541_1 /ASSEMBLY_ACC=CAM_ASM_001124 /TAXON_ID=119497 /ORGANISM="Exanthemachrysis gayraliae, Strain RCC1523" /LENGTH=168 /DNA_ID=CAMNT_0053391047 /DNA_START=105 /DNA_END=609 /DNA_ORIENTATION=+